MRTDRASGRTGLLLRAALAAALGWALPGWAPPPAVAQAQADSLTVSITPRDVWPPSPVTDLSGLAGAEGQMLLEWTAPDSNTNVVSPLSPVSIYEIRLATFSIASVGGSTATWWALATDVTLLPAPATPATPPVPAFPGTRESLLLTRLEPGVTHYAMIVSRDAVGQYSDGDSQAVAGTQANALVYDAVPPAPLGLSVAQTGRSTFTVTFSSVNVYDLDFYRLYVDSTTPYSFTDAWTVVRDSPTATAAISFQLGGLSTGTYHFRLASVDKGSPTYGGWALESAYATFTADLVPYVLRPQTPFGIALTTAGFTTTLRWMPVVRYADGIPFVDPAAPTVDELTGYRVYRATTPFMATWTEQAVINSTSTLTWMDLAGGSQYYYHVKAENATGFSRPSVVRAAGSRSAWVIGADDQSTLEVFSNSLQPVEGVGTDPMTAYLLEASSRPEDLSGRVLRSIDFGAWQGGLMPAGNLSIPAMGRLRMHYDLGSAGTVTAQGYDPSSSVAATPQNMSVYWNNGSRWVQLYGELDAASQVVTIETKYFGKYQLRSVERPQAFNFNQAGVSNRMATPNGDGKNDDIVFTYDNPRDSDVTVRVLDIRGKQIASGLPAGPVSNSKVWRPSPNIPGGVYIYQIESEGQVFTGTIVIIK